MTAVAPPVRFSRLAHDDEHHASHSPTPGCQRSFVPQWVHQSPAGGQLVPTPRLGRREDALPSGVLTSGRTLGCRQRSAPAPERREWHDRHCRRRSRDLLALGHPVREQGRRQHGHAGCVRTTCQPRRSARLVQRQLRLADALRPPPRRPRLRQLQRRRFGRLHQVQLGDPGPHSVAPSGSHPPDSAEPKNQPRNPESLRGCIRFRLLFTSVKLPC